MSKESAAGGVGCFGMLAILLTVLFVGLKLTEHIAWSWIWVLAPLWIYVLLSIVLLIVIFTVVFAFVFLAHMISGR